PRSNILKQIRDVLDKHHNEPGIIYCLRRDDVDNISAKLNDMGFKNLPYHAGLTDEIRHIHQDKFVREEVDIMVATVAFGMGIDRSNIRFIIHAAMPKNIEYYHQETGRAGRDGLPAYCYMFYSGSDFRTWSYFFEKNSETNNQNVMMDKLKTLYNFCSQPQCRHKMLSNYFGHDHEKDSCDACDFCLGEFDMVDESLNIGQKVLFCVYEATQEIMYGFGAAHITNILKGHLTENVERRNHQYLSHFGVMKDETLSFIRYIIEQMIGQGFLQREGEYQTLSLTDSGIKVMRGDLKPVLVRPLEAKKKKEISKKRSEIKARDWEGIDRGLFQLLRKKRAELAQKHGVPAFIIFGDKSLKDMAAIKPMTKDEFKTVFGVGEQKAKIYADIFIDIVKEYTNPYV
ncbi:MAG: HRDC domain-containing protein, partial [Candidatus Omnitrophica bacterium]|nr:HRDC domain-containing protein [Candidatus Omnitrophota bacterium]